MSSRCWKRRRVSGPSNAEGRSRERGTETQKEAEERGSEGGGDRDPEGRGTETQGRNSSRDQEKPTEPQTGGQGRRAIRRARTKGPGVPSPSFPQPPSGEGLAREGTSPPAPAPPPPTPPPVRWARIQLKFPVTFRRPGTGKTFSNTDPASLAAPRLPQLSQDLRVRAPIPLFLRTLEPRARQRPQAEPAGAAAFRTPVGQNPSPALAHVARQRDGGAG